MRRPAPPAGRAPPTGGPKHPRGAAPPPAPQPADPAPDSDLHIDNQLDLDLEDDFDPDLNADLDGELRNLPELIAGMQALAATHPP